MASHECHPKWSRVSNRSINTEGDASNGLRLADEVGGVGADLLAVEDVEHAELLDRLLAEAAQRDVDQFAAEALGEPPPAGAGGAALNRAMCFSCAW